MGDRPSMIAMKAELSLPLEKTNAEKKRGFTPGEQRKLQNHFCFSGAPFDENTQARSLK